MQMKFKSLKDKVNGLRNASHYAKLIIATGLDASEAQRTYFALKELIKGDSGAQVVQSIAAMF